MAISEFAPGSEVIAAKRIWKSQGIRILPHHHWETKKYAICKNCQKFHYGTTSPPTCECGEVIKPKGEYINPEHGFVAANRVTIVKNRPKGFMLAECTLQTTMIKAGRTMNNLIMF